MVTETKIATPSAPKATYGNPPAVGMRYTVNGKLGAIVRVMDFGTMDVVLPDGHCYRVTGLGWGRLIKAGK